MTDSERYRGLFATYHALEYFQYLRHHIDVDIYSTQTDDNFIFSNRELRKKFDQVFKDNNIMSIIRKKSFAITI
jgi:hypothetical protein